MLPANKKISILHPYIIKKGWAVKMMFYLSNFLSKNNNVKFYTFSYNENIFPINNKVIYFNNIKIIKILKIAYYIRNSDYIIIWNSPMQFVWVISKIIFRSKAKIIWWQHHYPWYYSKNTNVLILLKKIFERIIIKKIDSIIVNSKYLQEAIKNIYNIDSKILYPVLDNDFLNYSQNRYKESKKNIIFSYSRWWKWKNLSLIFKTYESIKNKNVDLILIIWWDWEEINLYKNNYINDKNVIFLWIIWNIEIIKNLERSSLFLFPSKIDSFWLVILESMSIWIPVISFNIAWAKEIIKNWINWYLVNSDTEFIEKTHQLLIDKVQNNVSYKSRCIETARNFWEENFYNNLKQIFNNI